MATDYGKKEFGGVRSIPFEIASGSTTSDTIKLDGRTVVGLVIPVAPSGATFTFQAALPHDSANFYTVKDQSNLAITITTGVGVYKLSPSEMDGLELIRVVSASSEAALRSLTLLVSNYKS